MARLLRFFAPKDRAPYDLLEQAADILVRAAGMLERLLDDWPESDLAGEILSASREGDRITRAIVGRLGPGAGAPVRREALIALAASLDDILDSTEKVADLMGLYRIEAPMDQALQLGAVLHKATQQIARALPRLRSSVDVSDLTVEIRRLEDEGDRIAREALGSLFERGIDPMMVIRWKDIFERLQHAINATETVADLLQGIRQA